MKNILIVRLSAIGDVALSTALLPGIRKAWPTAHIHWLTEDMGAEVLRGNQDIEDLIVVPRKRWTSLLREHRYLTLWRETRELRKRLRAIEADMAIDAQGLLRSAIWTYASHAKIRIGLRAKEGAQYLMTQNIRVVGNPTGRMCNEYRCLLEETGMTATPFSMSLHPTHAARERALREIPEGARSPVFFYPFTTWPQKHWPEENWARLAARVVQELERPVWILGGPSNEEAANHIAQQSGVADRIRVVAGKSSCIEDKMGLIERGVAAIGVDTGLSHISLGLGTPTVVIFGATCGYTDTAPLKGAVLYAKMPCSPCRHHPTCNGDFTCQKRITVDNAFEVLQQFAWNRR